MNEIIQGAKEALEKMKDKNLQEAIELSKYAIYNSVDGLTVNPIDVRILETLIQAAQEKEFWCQKWSDEVNTHAEVMRDNARLRGEVINLKSDLAKACEALEKIASDGHYPWAKSEFMKPEMFKMWASETLAAIKGDK